jgi:hypothetical protein
MMVTNLGHAAQSAVAVNTYRQSTKLRLRRQDAGFCKSILMRSAATRIAIDRDAQTQRERIRR